MSLAELSKQLLEAVTEGSTDKVRDLLSQGASFTADRLGNTALHLAAKLGHVEIADVLISAGVGREGRSKVAQTAMHVAVLNERHHVVELLVSKQADVNVQDMLSMTPLHWAVERGHVDTIQLLLSCGASLHIVNKFMKTPVDLAVRNGRADLVELLQRYNTSTTDEAVSSGSATDDAITCERPACSSTGHPSDTTFDASSHTQLSDSIQLLEQTSTLHEPPSSTQADKCLRLESDDSLPCSASPVPVQSPGDEVNSQAKDLETINALAEGTAPVETTDADNSDTVAAEMLKWLATHGVVTDETSIVKALLDSGQMVVLTEAGKLLVNKASQPTEQPEDSENNLTRNTQSLSQSTSQTQMSIYSNILKRILDSGQAIVLTEAGKLLINGAVQCTSITSGQLKTAKSAQISAGNSSHAESRASSENCSVSAERDADCSPPSCKKLKSVVNELEQDNSCDAVNSSHLVSSCTDIVSDTNS